MTRLLIVESPNKTEKIQHYLGSGWVVAASYGHIRDLPPGEMGVAPPDYRPQYVTGERSGKTIAKLKALARDADEIWLATDPDREGEAIAWHLQQVIGHGKTCRRVTFNEITQSAVAQAIRQPRQVDTKLFAAQEARRVLDRLYGYKVSPLAGNKLGQRGISAGRVQSPALRLVVEREEAIRAFTKTKHFGVVVELPGDTDAASWSAQWDSRPLVTDDHPYITNRDIAVAVLEATRPGLIVTAFEEKTQARKAPPPFTTSTLQQAAANRLKIGVETTMKLAQALFEAGLITYHRTDNPNLSQEGVQMVWDYLRAKGQAQYIPEKANAWKAKDGAQEAHEAIRPTDFHTYDPQSGNAQQDALYKLIWRRALACQMKDAQFQVRTAQLATLAPVAALQGLPPGNTAPPPKALFKASGSLRIYDGWMRVADDDYTSEEEQEAANPLPKLTVGAQYVAQDGQILDLETKPPSRYSEPALIRALEREGIGRPSTYANIISTIQQRGYVDIVKRQFVPTELGTALILALRGRFDFLEIAYTRDMEDHLDAIAQGKAGYRAVVAHYDQALDAQLAVFTADTSIQPLAGAEENYPCPNCDDGHLRRLKGKNGYFWGCSNYQREPNPCQTTLPDARGKPGKPVARIEKSTEHPCPACGEGYLQRRPGKKKNTFWWGCDRYPACTHSAPDDNGKPGMWGERPPAGSDGTKKKAASGRKKGSASGDKATPGKNSKALDKTYPCTACGKGWLQARSGSRGAFWGCSNYPDCKHCENDAHGVPQNHVKKTS
jgi:DNA topoisomerase I